MATPTNPTPAERAEQFRTEIRDLLDALDTKLESMRADLGNDLEALRAELQQMREGLTHAASQPAAQTGSFVATAIEHERSKGKDTYKMTGPKYAKYGVRVWPEVLQSLGYDLDELASQDRTEITPPVEVRVEITSYTSEDGVIHANSPRKVLGKA